MPRAGSTRIRRELRRHALLSELADRALRLLEREAHAAEHVRRLGELDLAVLDHLDAIAPGIEEIQERPAPDARLPPLRAPGPEIGRPPPRRSAAAGPRAASWSP